jgi:phospholipase/carboxylesterase
VNNWNIVPVHHRHHGRDDDVLPFEDSVRLLDMLERKGFSVVWHPFDDGHTITAETLEATQVFLSGEGG